MSKVELDWVVELVNVSAEKVVSKKVSHLDDYVNEIMAIKKIGLTWDKTAEKVNQILKLNGSNKVAGRKLARIAAKWKALGLIDEQKVQALNKEVIATLEKQTSIQHDTKPILQTNAKVASPPVDSFLTVEDFDREVVRLFPSQSDNKELVTKVYEENKGEAKDVIIEAYRKALLDFACMASVKY